MTEGEERIETDVQESDPSGNGPQGLTGDLGISSERTGGPGDKATGTYGVSDTSRAEVGDVDGNVDRTAGEENPAEVPEHGFDADRNPGHSHG
jgi:hypothetical protein